MSELSTSQHFLEIAEPTLQEVKPRAHAKIMR